MSTHMLIGYVLYIIYDINISLSQVNICIINYSINSSLYDLAKAFSSHDHKSYLL